MVWPKGVQVRFCPNGHDKEVVGRDNYGRCLPCRKERTRRYMKRVRYNVTDKQISYMATIQNYKCRVCKKDTKNLVIDHCHSSGRVRGLLCKNCNFMLGLAKDDIEILRSAVDYLKLNT